MSIEEIRFSIRDDILEELARHQIALGVERDEEDAMLNGLDDFMLIGSGCDGWHSRWGYNDAV